jgi:Uma2 family endonuclease
LRPPAPIHFPTGQKVPEGNLHWLLLVVLWDSVREALGDASLVAPDMFLYWDPTNPRRCLAPDLAVRVGEPSRILKSWKTWEHGAPHVGVEIVSTWDKTDSTTEEKLERYRQAGIAEVVRFDPEEKDAAQRLRFWDLVEGDMVERDPGDPEARRCDALGLYWCVVESEHLGLTLRLARDKEGRELLLTSTEKAHATLAAVRSAKEAERVQKEAERAEKEAERAEKEAERVAKEAALARIAELEAELAKRH